MFGGFGSLSAVFAAMWQLVHIVPPVVGLVLVGRMTTTQRWRTWALVSFGLALFVGLASTGFTLALATGLSGGFASYGTIGALQGLLSLAGLASSSFGVAAVVSDRGAAPAHPPQTGPTPSP